MTQTCKENYTLVTTTKESADLDKIISLLIHYHSDWMYRHDFFWKQTYKFYFVSLSIILLPNLTDCFGLTLPPLPNIAFRIIGLFLSLFFLFSSIGYAKRVEASRITYAKINEMLPQDLQRTSLEMLRYSRIFRFRASYVISIAMTFSLWIIGLLLILAI